MDLFTHWLHQTVTCMRAAHSALPEGCWQTTSRNGMATGHRWGTGLVAASQRLRSREIISMREGVRRWMHRTLRCGTEHNSYRSRLICTAAAVLVPCWFQAMTSTSAAVSLQ